MNSTIERLSQPRKPKPSISCEGDWFAKLSAVSYLSPEYTNRQIQETYKRPNPVTSKRTRKRVIPKSARPSNVKPIIKPALGKYPTRISPKTIRITPVRSSTLISLEKAGIV